MTDVSSSVYKIVSETFGVPQQRLHPNLRIRSIPDAESVKVLNAILRLERLYGIEIPDDATFRIETLGEFDRLVQRLCVDRAGAGR